MWVVSVAQDSLSSACGSKDREPTLMLREAGRTFAGRCAALPRRLSVSARYRLLFNSRGHFF